MTVVIIHSSLGGAYARLASAPPAFSCHARLPSSLPLFTPRRSRLEFLLLCELMKLPTIKQENAAVARAINKTVGQHTWRMRNNIEC